MVQGRNRWGKGGQDGCETVEATAPQYLCRTRLIERRLAERLEEQTTDLDHKDAHAHLRRSGWKTAGELAAKRLGSHVPDLVSTGSFQPERNLRGDGTGVYVMPFTVTDK